MLINGSTLYKAELSTEHNIWRWWFKRKTCRWCLGFVHFCPKLISIEFYICIIICNMLHKMDNKILLCIGTYCVSHKNVIFSNKHSNILNNKIIMRRFMIFFVYLYLNVDDYALGQIGSSQKLVSTVCSKNTGHYGICDIFTMNV